MIVALDGTILTVAQPRLQRDLGASVAQVQWTSTGYLLAVAALLVIAGRLGDRYGHQRMLLVGLVGFAATSAGVALSPDIDWVIAMRAAQGVFGALLQPATLALLRLAYPADRLSTPVAIRTSAIGVAAAAGPLLGGVLVTQLGWRAVFVVNIPFALAIALVTLAVRVPMPAPTGPERLDLAGAALLATALAVLVHTLAGVPGSGWTATPTGLGLAAAAGVAAAFVRHERRAEHPIVPRAVARSTPVTASMAMLLTTTCGLFGALFVTTFFLQDVRGLDPLTSALWGIPLTVLMILGAPLATAVLRRQGPRHTAMGGIGLVAVAIAALSRQSPTSSWLLTSGCFALLGAGFSTVMVTATGTVVGDAPPGYAGVVGGLKQTANNLGPTLGIAIAAGLSTLSPTLLTLAALTALGLIPAALLPRTPTPTPTPTRTQAQAQAQAQARTT